MLCIGKPRVRRHIGIDDAVAAIPNWRSERANMIVDDLERQQVDVTEVVSDDDIILKSRGFAALWTLIGLVSCNFESYAEYYVLLYFVLPKHCL